MVARRGGDELWGRRCDFEGEGRNFRAVATTAEGDVPWHWRAFIVQALDDVKGLCPRESHALHAFDSRPKKLHGLYF